MRRSRAPTPCERFAECPARLRTPGRNPATRTLRVVKLADAESADMVFEELMGSEVEGRKKWIMANAKQAVLDV